MTQIFTDCVALYFCIHLYYLSKNATLIVYHPLCTEQNEHLLYQLASGAIFNLLGERSFGLDIRGMEVANPGDVEELEALLARIGLRTSGAVLDSEGNLVMG